MKNKVVVIVISLMLSLLLGSCGTIFGGGEDLESTRVALSVQQTQLALDQGQAGQPQPEEPMPEEPMPEEPMPEEPMPEEPRPDEPRPEEPQPEEPMPEELFLMVVAEPKEFHCFMSGGPIELTVTVEMSDVDRGGNLFWRLHEKSTGTKLPWEVVDMLRADDNTRAFTFNADMPGGTNNFSYPPGMTESWFEFQIVSNDGEERTEVFTDVTFFPCP